MSSLLTIFNWWDVTTSPYTNIMGSWFYIIILSVITMGIYLKTEDLTVAGAFLLIASTFLSPIITAIPEGKLAFMVTIAIGITVTIVGFYTNASRRAI